MNKYNEIMNHIEMDDERRSRILEGINLQLENKITETEEKSEKKTSGISVKWIVAASIAASVLIIAIPLNFFRIDPDNPDGPTIEMPEETTVSSEVYESDIFSETDISSVPSSSVTESEGNETTGTSDSLPVPVTVPETAAGISPSPSASPSHSPAPVNTPSPSVKPPSQTTENEEPDESGPPALWTQPPSLTDPDTTEITTEPEEDPGKYTVYESLEELVAATGYSVSHLPDKPFAAEQVGYSSYYSDSSVFIAEIQYISYEYEIITYMTCDENIPYTDEYINKETITVGDTSVMIYTTDYNKSVFWFDGGYWHQMDLYSQDNPDFFSTEIITAIVSAQLGL